MWEKYIVVINDVRLALKFNGNSKILILGGNFKFKRIMQAILEEYFGKKSFLLKQLGYNKIKYECKLTDDKFGDGLNKLRLHHFVVEQVKNHGELMR